MVAHGGEAQPTASGGSAPDRVTGPVEVRDRSLCSDPPINRSWGWDKARCMLIGFGTVPGSQTDAKAKA